MEFSFNFFRTSFALISYLLSGFRWLSEIFEKFKKFKMAEIRQLFGY